MKRVLFILLWFALAGTVLAGLVGVAGYIYFSRDLPSFTKVSDYQPPQVTTIYARDGSIMGYFYGDEKRFMITLDEVSPWLIKAVLAKEDATFYEHKGINPKAILRAAVKNFFGSEQQGASTITQQIVKRLVVGREKSYQRKIREMILAIRLERYLSKDEILTIYMNQIFLGHGSYGFECAAQTYFAKHAKDLNIAESAVLACLPKAPSAVNPYTNPVETRRQQIHTLNRMKEEGWITEAQYKEALDFPLEYKKMPEPSALGAWYREEVRRRLVDFFSPENVEAMKLPITRYRDDAVRNGGLHIYTSMDPDHQRAAETALRKGLLETSKRMGWQGPIAHIAPEKYQDFLDENPFFPDMLDNAGWVKALVTKVGKDGAEVRMGDYKGLIAHPGMEWSKRFNSKAEGAPEIAGRATLKGVEPGDVVWVAAFGAKGDAHPVSVPYKPADENGKGGIPAYEPHKVTTETAIKVTLEQVPLVDGAVVSIENETGDLVAMVGGYAYSVSGDYRNSFNRATQAVRQPGSSFKPIVYSAAMDNGYTAGSILNDAPFVIEPSAGAPGWSPSNFDNSFLGPLVLRTALALSRNVCTVRVAQSIGMDAVVQRAHDLGIKGNIPPVLAVSLGAYDLTPLDLTTAYTAFANNGDLVMPRMVISIKDSWGKPIVNFSKDVKKEAITPQNAYIMSFLLKEVVNAGTATAAKVLDRPVAGKTGTTNESRDAWFIGFSPYLTSGIYVGYDAHQPMGGQETGGRAAVPIFTEYRKAIDKKYEPTDFTRPDGIVFATVDAETGYLPTSNTIKSFNLPFKAGTEPTTSVSPDVEVDIFMDQYNF